MRFALCLFSVLLFAGCITLTLSAAQNNTTGHQQGQGDQPAGHNSTTHGSTTHGATTHRPTTPADDDDDDVLETETVAPETVPEIPFFPTADEMKSLTRYFYTQMDNGVSFVLTYTLAIVTQMLNYQEDWTNDMIDAFYQAVGLLFQTIDRALIVNPQQFLLHSVTVWRDACSNGHLELPPDPFGIYESINGSIQLYLLPQLCHLLGFDVPRPNEIVSQNDLK